MLKMKFAQHCESETERDGLKTGSSSGKHQQNHNPTRATRLVALVALVALGL